MTSGNNEPRHDAGAGGRHESAMGGAGPKVAHPTDKTRQGRQAFSSESPRRPAGFPNGKPETEPAAIIADYWHAAKARYKRGDYADYGSPDWCALPLEDPRKMAGLVAFAQLWLRYGDEIADNLNQLLAPEPLWQRATTEALDGAFRDILAQQQRTRKEAA